jgi:hypothetical protein
MKLIHCHIINFGKLHDYNIDFDPHKNIICSGNGSGKSTLAAFIRVMFYGFEGEKIRNPIDRERSRYTPWQGGVYGGSLVFETSGKIYTLSRTFGSKSKDDTFDLRDRNTNLPVNDFSTNIGRELFAIDSASFLRSAFITQNDCITSTTDDINSKISNLSDDTNDLNRYEAVNDTLDGLLNKLTPRRKTGQLYALEEEISSLTTAVTNGRQIEETLAKVQELRDKEQSGMDQARKERAENVELQSRVAATANRKHWDDLCQDYADKEAGFNHAKESFPAGVPAESELDQAIRDYRTAETRNHNMQTSRLTDEDILNIKRYRAMFHTGFQPEEYTHFKSSLSDLVTLRQDIAGRYLSKEENEHLEELKILFQDDRSPVSTINQKQQLWRERCTRQDTLLLREASLASMKSTSSTLPETKRQLPLLICGIVLILFGIILFAMKQMIGLLPVILGIILSIAGGIPRKDEAAVQRNQQTADSLQALEAAVLKDRQRIAAIEQDIRSYLERFHVPYAEADLEQSLQKILNQSLEYETLAAKSKKASDPVMLQTASANSNAIREYLHRYNVDVEESQFSDGLAQLRDDARIYNELLNKSNIFNENEQLYQEALGKVTAFLEKYDFSSDAVSFEYLTNLRDTVHSFREAERAFHDAADKKTDFEAHNDIQKMIRFVEADQLPTLQEIDTRIQALDQQIDDYDNRMDEYDARINQLMEEYDEWIEHQKQLELKSAQYDTLKKKYELLLRTKEYLQTAKEGLIAKYSGSMEQNFKKYIGMLTNAGTDAYYLDANANITKEEHGHQRDTRLLSAGYQDLIGFCLRISFVDAMFQAEKPFLILDDPFVNLDPVKTACGMKLLDQISSDYQIVYFTCHSSRT